MTETPHSPMQEQFAKLPPAYREPLPSRDRATLHDATGTIRATEDASAAWDALPQPAFKNTVQTRGELHPSELDPSREIPAHATPDQPK